MSEEKDPKAQTPPPPPGSRGSKLLPIFVGLNSLLLVGVMGVLVMQMRKASHPPEHSEEAQADQAHESDEAPAAGDESAKKEEPKEEKKDEKKEEKAEGKDEKKPGAPGKGVASGLGPLVKLSDFVIHLRNPEIDRYARLSFDVEVFADSDKESLNAHMPRVRDAFISYLSDRTLEELQGAEGLGRTKDALQLKLRDLVPEARVRSLYISDFVVQ
ncbi:MAG: flagellar basal body-associated FliL family protein [Myxococcaceae bacterium]|jgi:flagellar FliL protein|nr:flagellar basal body-associated FliL family protein [Myxococcaceae bacterium]MCA3014802.1 flagellar basal body-associated FliL family protein [Myxococcaceae bacterium]